MTATLTTDTPTKGPRLALLIGGIAAVAFGIAVLVWPSKAAAALTGIIAIYAIVAGLVYVFLGATSKALGTGGRIGHVLLGVLYVVAGIYAFTSLQQSAVFLGLFLTIMVGVMWLVEGFTALFTLDRASSKGLTIAFAIISVIAGFNLLSAPIWGTVFLWWFFGVALIVLGALNVGRAIIGRKDAPAGS